MSTTAENFKEYLEREPFTPFRLVMTSGQSYDVVGPSFAALLESEVFVVFSDGERWAHVPFLQIASTENIANDRSRQSRSPK